MKRATAAVTAAFTVLLGGCAMTEPPAQLNEAAEKVTAVQDNPAVSRYAPASLYEAQQALDMAQKLYREGAPLDTVEHFAYLAERQAQIAEVQARRALVQRSVAEAQQQRQMLILQQREQALAMAQTQAQRAQEEAARLRQQARQQQDNQVRQQAQAEQERLRAQLAEAQQRLAELQPQQTDRGIVLTLDEVLFGFDKATLDAGNLRAVDRLAQFLETNPNYQILIEGHTDAVGSEQYNQQLSEQRAQAVREALAQRGIDPQRVRIAGLGEEFPVAPNETDQGRLQNRRVEVVIAEDAMPPTRREAQMARGREAQQRGQAQPQG